MDTVEIQIGDKTFTFKAEIMPDCDFGPPWEESNGPVSEVKVTLLDEVGEETEVFDSLCLENSDEDYLNEEIRRMADDLASGYGVSWGEVERQTYGYFTFANKGGAR